MDWLVVPPTPSATMKPWRIQCSTRHDTTLQTARHRRGVKQRSIQHLKVHVSSLGCDCYCNMQSLQSHYLQIMESLEGTTIRPKNQLQNSTDISTAHHQSPRPNHVIRPLSFLHEKKARHYFSSACISTPRMGLYTHFFLRRRAAFIFASFSSSSIASMSASTAAFLSSSSSCTPRSLSGLSKSLARPPW
jgi:hypothetical protein